jgi:hypothetical protein
VIVSPDDRETILDLSGNKSTEGVDSSEMASAPHAHTRAPPLFDTTGGVPTKPSLGEK